MVHHVRETGLEFHFVDGVGLAAKGEGRVRGNENKQQGSFCVGGGCSG